MSTELVIKQESTVLTQAGLDETRQQLDLLEHFVSDVLRVDQDFGVIPGTGSKPTLLKPGAANIIAAFQCHSEPRVVEAILDRIGKFVSYAHAVDVVRNESGRVVASGMGGCNSYEIKYRYRDQKRECPECRTPSIIKGKQEYGGGWICFKKQGGCGAKFSNDDTNIISQATGRVENNDPLDLANTIMKMSIKRAEVDAAMKLPGVARFFTQDLEDMTTVEQSDEPVRKKSNTRRKAAPADPGKVTITSAEANGLMAYADELGVPRPDVMAELGYEFELDSPLKMDAAQLEAMRKFIEANAPANDYETPTDVEDH